jgi:hypothetical protein
MMNLAVSSERRSITSDSHGVTIRAGGFARSGLEDFAESPFSI